MSGILGSVLLLGVFGFLAAFVGLETVEGEEAVARFPDIRWARIIENTAYLFTLALWALHSVALLIALRPTRFGMALAGTVISFLGLAVLAAGAIPHTATTAISEIYHAPETVRAPAEVSSLCRERTLHRILFRGDGLVAVLQFQMQSFGKLCGHSGWPVFRACAERNSPRTSMR